MATDSRAFMSLKSVTERSFFFLCLPNFYFFACSVIMFLDSVGLCNCQACAICTRYYNKSTLLLISPVLLVLHFDSLWNVVYIVRVLASIRCTVIYCQPLYAELLAQKQLTVFLQLLCCWKSLIWPRCAPTAVGIELK